MTYRSLESLPTSSVESERVFSITVTFPVIVFQIRDSKSKMLKKKNKRPQFVANSITCMSFPCQCVTGAWWTIHNYRVKNHRKVWAAFILKLIRILWKDTMIFTVNCYGINWKRQWQRRLPGPVLREFNFFLEGLNIAITTRVHVRHRLQKKSNGSRK